MDKSHKIKNQGRRISGGPSVCRKSLAEFRRPQAAEENQPQGSLLAAQPLWPTLQTCHRHVCLRCGVGKTLCAERASQVLSGTEAQAQRIPPWRKRRQPFSTVSRAAGFPAALDCLERRHIFLLSWQAAMVLARRKSWNTDMGKSIPTAMAAARSMVVRP